jgi:hypothetical protein
VVEGAAGGAESGEILADGRVVEVPTVVKGVVSATRGPLHGAHMNRSANTTRTARPAIIGVLMPPSRASRLLLRVDSPQSSPENQLSRIGKVPVQPRVRMKAGSSRSAR